MCKILNAIKKHVAFFLIGGAGYAIIELLWRGYTHPTMFFAGGLSFVMISKVAERQKEKPLLVKAVISALGVTAVELLFGIVFNIIFKMHIWDYSKVPFNFLGQVCPVFTVAWGILALVFLPIADFLNGVLGAREGR